MAETAHKITIEADNKTTKGLQAADSDMRAFYRFLAAERQAQWAKEKSEAKAHADALANIEKQKRAAHARDTKLFHQFLADERDTKWKAEKTAAERQQKMGIFGGLKSSFGEDSAFGLGAKTLMGAGALAGVGFVANAFGELGTNAAELAKQYKTGAISSQELTQRLLEGLPILGDMFRGARGLGEAFFEATGFYDEFRERTNRALEADANRISAREGGKKRAEVAGSFAEFDESLGTKPRSVFEERLARHRNDIKKLGGLGTQEGAANSGFDTEAMIRRVEADERLSSDLRDIGVDESRQRTAASRSRRSGRVGAFQELQRIERENGERDASEFSERQTRQRQARNSRFRGRLNSFFEQNREARENDFGPRFAAGVESAGTGAGAIARARTDPSIQLARESNRTLNDTKVAIENGNEKIVKAIEKSAKERTVYNGAQT